MKTRDVLIEVLRTKGELTILETDSGCIVAIKAKEHVITLQNRDADTLLSELEKFTEDWPTNYLEQR